MEDLFGVGFVIFIIIFVIGMYVLSSIPLYKLAKKANHHSPIWAWIPILCNVQLLQISKQSVWLILLLMIPYVNIVVLIYVLCKFLESFGQANLLMILLVIFIPLVPYYIMAFKDDIRYQY